MKFTTKIVAKTGNYRAFQPDYAHIKVKGKICGFISENEVCFHIAKPDGDGKVFYNAKLKKEFSDFKEAYEYVRSMKEPSFADRIVFLED